LLSLHLCGVGKYVVVVHANMVVGLGWFHFNITTIVYLGERGRGWGEHKVGNKPLSS